MKMLLALLGSSLLSRASNIFIVNTNERVGESGGRWLG
jgi:hypothetical protein